MPTSSIFTNIVITAPQQVERFVDALEQSSHAPAWVPKTSITQLTDPEAIRALFVRRFTENKASFQTGGENHGRNQTERTQAINGPGKADN